MGLTALRIAVMLGARVIATSGSDAKLERARELGAVHTINYRKQKVAQEVRAYTGKRGVDVVVENVGEATWAESLRSLAKGGGSSRAGGRRGRSS